VDRSRRKFLAVTIGSALFCWLPGKNRTSRKDLERPRRIGRLGTRIDARGGVAYDINETAHFILSRCDGQRSLDEIADELCAHYAVQRRRAHREVRAFVQQLQRAGLVT
jgi:hypothetical protein